MVTQNFDSRIASKIVPNLIWKNGYITKHGDAGDGMSANAAWACCHPDDPRATNYVEHSFIGDRPYRSPFHAADKNVDLENSFSRDHCLSLVWYSLFTGDRSPLERIARYASAHRLKIGAEGSYSQHGLTPNVMWAFHVAGAWLPWYYRVWASFVIALIQLLSARTVPASYRLNLCGEMALLAKLTGRWNFIWQRVADVCERKQPNNVYYQFVAGRKSKQEMLAQLESLASNYKPNHEWAWCWMNFEDGRLLACGPEMMMLEVLIRKHL